MKQMKTPTAQTAIERGVLSWARSYGDESTPEYVKKALTAVCEHGCQSGIVPGLIYHTDTTRYFRRNIKAISELLAELIAETGEPIDKLFPRWETEDPLALDTTNQNLLAWFLFEYTASQLLDRMEQ